VVNQRQRRAVSFYLLVSWLVSGVGLFLSLWIVVPAPTFTLLPLGVGAPEISPWLLGLNGLGLLLAGKGGIGLPAQSACRHQTLRIALGLSLIGLLLSALPLSQFAATNRRADAAMVQVFGSGYRADIPTNSVPLRSQPFVLLDALRGIRDRPVRHTSGIVFAKPDGVPLSLEIYRPPQVGVYPALIVIHGGAWQSGSPSDYANFSRYMAAQGYVVWAIAYRLAPRYQFPAQLQDVKTALAFIQTHAAEYETDPTRMALLGRSAGAQLALLAAYAPDAPPLKAVVSYYGPVDLTAGYYDLPQPDPINTRAVLRTFLGGTPVELGDRYRAASPLNFVTRPLPPSLLVYGDRDHIVLAKFGRRLATQLQRVGSPVVYLEIPWAEHAFDTIFHGVSNQLTLYYTERFLALTLKNRG